MKPVFPYPWILQMHHRDFQDQFKVWGAITVIWNSPQSCPCPGPGTCEHVTSVGRGDFAGRIKLRPLKWGQPWLPGGTQCHHRVLIKGGWEVLPWWSSC